MNSFELITDMEKMLNEAVPRAQSLYHCGKSNDGTILIESSTNIDPETDEYIRTYYITVITEERTKHYFESLEDAHGFVVEYHNRIMSTTQEEANESDALTGMFRELDTIADLKTTCPKCESVLKASISEDIDYILTCPECNTETIANHLV